MWDILYFCRNFVLTNDQCDQVIKGELKTQFKIRFNFLLDYFNAQTYDENLTLEKLQEGSDMAMLVTVVTTITP